MVLFFVELQKCDTLLSQARQLGIVPINGEKYPFLKVVILKKFWTKTDIFHHTKPIFFTSNWCETDIFRANMRRNRIFSENIPLLYIADRKTPEKYMFRAGSEPVFILKNITSGF